MRKVGFEYSQSVFSNLELMISKNVKTALTLHIFRWFSLRKPWRIKTSIIRYCRGDGASATGGKGYNPILLPLKKISLMNKGGFTSGAANHEGKQIILVHGLPGTTPLENRPFFLSFLYFNTSKKFRPDLTCPCI